MTSIVNLDAWREQALEALGATTGISFQPQPGGDTFVVPHPLTLDDEQNSELDRASGALAIAVVLLGGQPTYTRFVAAGGRASDVMMAWRMMQQGVDLDPNSAAFTPWSAGAPANSSPTSSITIPASIEPSISGGAPSSPVPAN